MCHGPGLSGQKRKVDVPKGSEIYRFCFVYYCSEIFCIKVKQSFLLMEEN